MLDLIREPLDTRLQFFSQFHEQSISFIEFASMFYNFLFKYLQQRDFRISKFQHCIQDPRIVPCVINALLEHIEKYLELSFWTQMWKESVSLKVLPLTDQRFHLRPGSVFVN